VEELATVSVEPVCWAMRWCRRDIVGPGAALLFGDDHRAAVEVARCDALTVFFTRRPWYPTE